MKARQQVQGRIRKDRSIFPFFFGFFCFCFLFLFFVFLFVLLFFYVFLFVCLFRWVPGWSRHFFNLGGGNP